MRNIKPDRISHESNDCIMHPRKQTCGRIAPVSANPYYCHNPEVVFISLTWRTGEYEIHSEDSCDSIARDDDSIDDDGLASSQKIAAKKRSHSKVKKNGKKLNKSKASVSTSKIGGKSTPISTSASRKKGASIPDRGQGDQQRKRRSLDTSSGEDESEEECFPDSVEELKVLLKQKNAMLKKAWKMASRVSLISCCFSKLGFRYAMRIIDIVLRYQLCG